MSAASPPVKLPGEQCTAKAKATGKRCQRLTIGGGVCRMHGGEIPAVKRKRLERIALAQQLAQTPQRHPGTVLLDAVHTADVLAQRARDELADGEASPKTVRALINATERQAALARSALSAEAEDRVARHGEAQVEDLRRVLEHFMREVGLRNNADAEAALARAVDAVAPGAGPVPAMEAASKARGIDLRTEQVEGIVKLIDWILDGLVLNKDDAWVRSTVQIGLRQMSRDGLAGSQPPNAPRSWWHQLAKRAALALGDPDPTQPPKVEILPPVQRPAITSGLGGVL